MKHLSCILLLAATASHRRAGSRRTADQSDPAQGSRSSGAGSHRTRGRSAASDRRHRQAEGQSAAAGRAHLSRSGSLRASIRRVLPGRRYRQGQGPVAARRGAGPAARRGQTALDHRHRTGRARLCFQNRQEHSALWPRRAAVVLAQRAAPLASRHLVPRPQRDLERSQLPGGSRAQSGTVYAARHDRAASLRALLQRQQVRRRGGPVRSAGRGQEAVSDR